MKDVRPFFIPSEASVRASPWQRRVDGEWEPLGDHIEDWDYATWLQLRCTVEADADQIRRETRLIDGSPLSWSTGWRAADTGLVGEPATIDLGASHVELDLRIPPDRAGATIVLTRRLVLRRDRGAAGPGEARWAGSVLWSDDTVVRLTGPGAAFPTEIIDFGAVGQPTGASWYLDLPASVDAPAMGSMMLLINSADKALVEAVSRARKHSDVQQALIDTMEEGVVEELVRWALVRWDEVTQAGPDSVGAAARSLTERVLPDPSGWSREPVDSMALKAAVVDGARRIGFGRKLS